MAPLWIPGQPMTAARPRSTGPGKCPHCQSPLPRPHSYLPREYAAWQEAAAWHLRVQHPERHTGKVEVLAAVHPNGIRATVLPYDHMACGRAKGITGDIDNYAKATLDALQAAGAFENDRQVVSLQTYLHPDPYDPKDHPA